ncbi:MAG: hypothetical protein MK212_14495 [Saprospiraceae bacterium]|nr:hypothetical protein [Saprospiraceae bacterium]
MERLLEPHFSWLFFSIFAFVVGLIYLSLRITYQKIQFSTLDRNLERILFMFLERTFIIYEPIAIILLASVWVLVDPVWHGILTLFLITITFPHIRNYITGRIIRLSNDIKLGKTVLLGKEQGAVSRLSSLGIYIMMDNGLRYFTYSQFAEQGYTILSGNDLGAYCTVVIELDGEKDAVQQKKWLFHMLMVVPYIDTSYYPNLLESEENQVKVKLLLASSHYHQYLISLIEDWGYTCKLVR